MYKGASVAKPFKTFFFKAMKTVDLSQQRLEQYRKFHKASRALTMAGIARQTAGKKGGVKRGGVKGGKQ